MCEKKGLEWPPDFDLFTILASPHARFLNDEDKMHPGANRLFQIMVTEAALLIWKLQFC
jgi:hypothetical protein